MLKDKQYIAVYGTLRRGEHQHFLLGRSKFMGEYRTDPIWSMWRMRWEYPALLACVSNPESIVVEVYEVTDNILKEVDKYEQYPYLYYRSKFDIGGYDCWVYYMTAGTSVREGRGVRIIGGDWLKRGDEYGTGY